MIEKKLRVMYGDLWATKHVFKVGNKVVGEIVQNPHSEQFEVLAVDHKNHKYVSTERNTYKEALAIIKEYEKDMKVKG